MLDSRLERTTLQLDGAQTKISDLERTNAELKRTNSEIQRQLAKWQNLETKGDQEVEILRKKRIELEVQVKELETRLVKNAEQTDQNVAALEKEKRRVEKYKQGVTEWQVLTNSCLLQPIKQRANWHCRQKRCGMKRKQRNLAGGSRRLRNRLKN